MTTTVQDNQDQARYEILDDGELAGFTQYRLHGDVAEFFHTETLSGFEGRGMATTLIRETLDDVRRRGWQLRPECPLVRSFLEKNPQYQDLVPVLEQPRYGLGPGSAPE